jgi:hypothetical protein
MTGKKNYIAKLSSPVTLKAGHFYALAAVLQSGTTLGACSSTYAKDTILTGVNGYLRLAGIPANGATWEVSIGTSPYAFGILIEV